MSTPELKFNNVIRALLELGVEINMRMQDGTVWYDLGTGMKSHLHVSCDGDNLVYKRRYDDGVITLSDDPDKNLNEVLDLVQGCLYSRDFCNSQWTSAFNQVGRNLFKELT